MSEIEYNSVAACKFETEGKIQTTSGDDGSSWRLLASSSTTSTIRLAPMERINRRKKNSPVRWKDDVHFHPFLHAKKSSSTNFVVLVEAIAREGFIVALSPKPGYSNGMFYEICFGSDGNTRTTIISRNVRRRGGGGGGGGGKRGSNNNYASSRPSRVCHEKSWTSYWICYMDGKVYAGVGEAPAATNALAVLGNSKNLPEEEQKDPTTPTADAAKDEEEDAAAAEAPTISVEPERTPLYVGLGNAGIGDRQAPAPLKIRNVRLCSGIPESLQSDLSPLTMDQLLDDTATPVDGTAAVLLDDDDEMDDETKELMKEYQDECRKAKSRADKFGVDYQQPPMDAFLPWSQARRLKANPKAGFVTGIDMMSTEEIAKQEARKKRFGVFNKELKEGGDDKAEGRGGDDAGGGDGAADVRTADDDAGSATKKGPSLLNPIQAWDNEEFVRGQRADPPPSLWKNPPADADGDADAFAMDEDKPTFVPEKVHIFSIDWAAFKQIRNQDVIGYFSMYGPTYVEWLGDLSCNVHFEDQYSAKRALVNLSQELTTPPPSELTTTTEEKSSAEVPPPPSEEEVGRDEVKAEDDERKETMEGESHNDPSSSTSPPDLGAMGWRLGNRTLRKIANDKYGRCGTTARILMRVATSLDILAQRPSSWPKPPPGFTTKRVLGPGSDFPGKDNRGGRRNNKGRNEKRKRRSSDKNNGDDRRKHWNPASGEEPPLLSGGLRSGRAGFSVEEMEAERAKKRTRREKEQE